MIFDKIVKTMFAIVYKFTAMLIACITAAKLSIALYIHVIIHSCTQEIDTEYCCIVLLQFSPLHVKEEV